MQIETIGGRVKPSLKWQARKSRKGKRGNPREPIDAFKVKKLAAVGMPVVSIARRLGYNESSFFDEKSKNPDIEDALIAGQYEFEEGLRTTQARLALSGHPGMLIWLGKQFLGQSDKQESKQETTVNIVLQNAMKELRDLDVETLVQMKMLMEKKEPLLIENGS